MRKFLFLVLVVVISSCTTTEFTTINSKMRLYDVCGRQIIQIHPNSLDIKQLNKGIYFIEEIKDNKPYWIKIVKI